MRAVSRARSIARLIGTVLSLGCLVAWLAVLRPPALGGATSLVGVDGISMTPTFHNGDMAVVEKKASYHIGDIIAYHIPKGEIGAGQNVIHRIVGGNGTTGFITKGDHNSYTDHFWHPTTTDVIGRVWFHIPHLAALLGKLRSPLTLALAVGLVAFVILVWPTKGQEDEESRRVHDDASPREDVEKDVQEPVSDSEPTIADEAGEYQLVGSEPRRVLL